MAFNFSLIFLFVLLSISGILIFQNKQQKWLVLLLLSLVFYFFIAKLAFLILIGFALIVFFAGKNMHLIRGNIQYLAIILICLAPMLIDKIYLTSRLQTSDYLKFIGISYISFNGLSYLFDIKKGYLKPEPNFLPFLLYLFYLPYIFIGPLHRYKNVAGQFKDQIQLSNENFSNGFRLILWGFFKHFVLAQRLDIVVETIFSHKEIYQGFSVYAGGFAFFLYLYCDFSSYVDIFQGISQIFGIKLKSNFRNQVYASSSRKHFWAGWHVTLNHWFRDYFFYPLSKFFRTKLQNNFLMVLTFILIGLWHEFSVKFLIWGILNASWILTENRFRNSFNFIPDKIRKPLGTFYHILGASLLAIVFRTNDLSGSLSALFSTSHRAIFQDWALVKQFGYILVPFILMDYINRKAGDKRMDEYIGSLTTRWRWSLYMSLILLILVLGVSTGNEAYYVRF